MAIRVVRGVKLGGMIPDDINIASHNTYSEPTALAKEAKTYRLPSHSSTVEILGGLTLVEDGEGFQSLLTDQTARRTQQSANKFLNSNRVL